MDILFLLALFLVAFLYSSVGHGGASGYLALMALFGMNTIFMRSSALTLNLFVSGIAFYSFYRGGYFKWRQLWPFIITSVPMAYLGGTLIIEPKVYKVILGICLLFAVGRMLLPSFTKKEIKPKFPILPAVLIGAAMGFVSGLIGIGGGIILSPLLILLRWATIKETAAVSAAFIFVNSVAGLLGQASASVTLSPEIILWIVIAFSGGLLGSHTGSFRLSFIKLRYVLAAVLLVASIKLFIF